MPNMQKKYQLKIPSQPENLAMIRDLVSKVATTVGFGDDEASKIELAVDEACTNVIKHAYGGKTDETIEVLIKIYKDKLVIMVSDKGKGFDPNNVKMPDLGESIKVGRKGGLGLCLIKTLMDKVEFQMKPGSKNQVKMVKFIH